MRKLNTEDFLREEKEWYKIHGEYIKKLVAINREENELYDNGTLTDEMSKEYEEKRKQLIQEYPNHHDRYKSANFYCLLNRNNIDQLIADECNGPIFKKELNLVGKLVETVWGNTYGKLVGIAVTIEDAYYVIEDHKTKKLCWESAVGGIRKYNKREHRGWMVVTTPDDKGYL